MLDRDRILDKIQKGYDARKRGDKAALADFWAPGATYKMVGEPSVLNRYPLGPMDAHAASSRIIDLIDFHALEQVDAIVEGNRAAIFWNVTMSSGGGEPQASHLYDLWELDDAGRAVSLVQFADTALVAAMLATE